MRQGNIRGGKSAGKSNGPKKEARKIDIKNPSDLKHWCDELSCTPDQLKVAIYKVGCNADTVRKYVQSLKHD